MTHLSPILQRIIVWFGVASGAAVLLMIIVICMDIAGRSLLGAPLWGATEISVLLLVCLIFLGLGRAQQERQHYRVELLVELLPTGIKRVFAAVSLVICLVIIGVLGWFSLKQGILAFNKGEVNYGNVPFPIWPARLVIAFGLFLMGIQFLIDLLRILRNDPRSEDQSTSHLD